MMMTRIHDATKRGTDRGAVLLEAVLALVLFAAASVVIGVALNGSMESVERLRLSTHASDIAVTTFSELQAGIRSAVEINEQSGPTTTNEWRIEVVTQPWGGTASMTERETSLLTDVEVIIRHESGFVQRGRQVMKLDAAEPSIGAGSQPLIGNRGIAAR